MNPLFFPSRISICLFLHPLLLLYFSSSTVSVTPFQRIQKSRPYKVLDGFFSAVPPKCHTDHLSPDNVNVVPLLLLIITVQSNLTGVFHHWRTQPPSNRCSL
ncbi:hypothetical protein CW304_28220 [Bacillus sp. UFRGS-B20]|nr:hypothetical protein CW304_28220 [Bacillus sp. UFRGS-B20]